MENQFYYQVFMKRVFFLIFSVLSFTFSTWARDFTIDGTTYTITDSISKKVKISVSDISGSFSMPSAVTNNNVSYTVTSIGDYAFSGTDISSVSIPSTITSIGAGAFYDCPWLNVVSISSSVDSIKYKTFDSCARLVYINIPSSVKYIGMFAFENCGSLVSLTLPSSLTYIEEEAFYYAGLKSVIIPSSVSHIGQCAFQCCPFETFTFANPSSLTTIENGVFTGCIYLKSLVIPPSIKTIEMNAFIQCWDLTSITIPSSVTTIESGAFSYCGKLNSITIPSSVTSIKSVTFHLCSGLTSINIPNSITSIDWGAFEFCSALTSITIPNSVTKIDGFAFYSSGLTSINIPNSVTSLGMDAFLDCKGLTSVSIPNSVTLIGDCAFQNCVALNSIHVNNSDPSKIALGYSSLFYNVPKSTCILYVPKGSKSLYSNAYQWSEFKNIVEEEDLDTGIEILSASELGLSIEGKQLRLSSLSTGVTVQVVAIDGRVIFNAKTIDSSISVALPSAGVYMIRVGNKIAKVLVS